jgi:hypothetical protein
VSDCPTCSTGEVRWDHGSAPCPVTGKRVRHLAVVSDEQWLATFNETWWYLAMRRGLILSDPSPFPKFNLFRRSHHR